MYDIQKLCTSGNASLPMAIDNSFGERVENDAQPSSRVKSCTPTFGEE